MSRMSTDSLGWRILIAQGCEVLLGARKLD
jgi:hypothetical protein